MDRAAEVEATSETTCMEVIATRATDGNWGHMRSPDKIHDLHEY